MSDAIIDTSDASFDAEVLRSDVPVLLSFTASWCGPCRALEPVLKEIADDFAGQAKIVKIDVDQCPETRARYHVLGIPQLRVVVGGETISDLGRVRNKSGLTKILRGIVDDFSIDDVLESHLNDKALRAQFILNADIDRVRTVLTAHPNYAFDALDWGTPVQRALMDRKPERVALLLEFDPELTVSEMAGAGLADRLASSLEKNPELANPSDEGGVPPLLIAIRCGQLECIDLLLDLGADVNWSPGGESQPYLLEVVESGRVNILDHLIRRGMDIHLPIGRGENLLHWACYFGQQDIIERLLQEGLDLGQTNIDGETPIEAAKRGVVEGFAEAGLVRWLENWKDQ